MIDFSAIQTISKDGTAPASSHVDMEESESTDSLSDEDGIDFRDDDFGSDIPSHATSSYPTPGSNFPSHAAFSTTIPGSYFSSQHLSPPTSSGILPVTEPEFSANLHPPQDDNDLFSSNPESFFNQDRNCLPVNNHTFDLGSQWNIPPLPTPMDKGDEAMADVEVECSKKGSTIILEGVQPQMVTKIVKMLFESKSAVNMKIVSQK